MESGGPRIRPRAIGILDDEAGDRIVRRSGSPRDPDTSDPDGPFPAGMD